MVLTRQEKKETVKTLQELMDNSQVVGLVNMENLPGKQLQKIKKGLRGVAQIKMSRKRIMNRAIDASKKKELSELNINKTAQPALIFSDTDSFKLFAQIKKRKIPAGAKVGAIVHKDIIIESGPTEIPPGPAMSEIQSIGLKTKVEGGKIVIQNTKKVLSPGDEITPEVANVLNKLGIEPLEIGLELVKTCENGNLLTREILDIDEDQYYNDVVSCAQKAFNLSVNAGIPTKQNITHIVLSAFQKAKNLGVNAEILDAGIVGDLISKAANEAKSLESQIDLKVHESPKGEHVEETKNEEKTEEAPVEEKKDEAEPESEQKEEEKSNSEEKKD